MWADSGKALHAKNKTIFGQNAVTAKFYRYHDLLSGWSLQRYEIRGASFAAFSRHAKAEGGAVTATGRQPKAYQPGLLGRDRTM